MKKNMPLPTPLLRRPKNSHKNNFGHALIISGSASMIGAGCLCALAALRSGAGLVTLGVPASLNSTAQKKINNEIMTLPLSETKNQTLSSRAFKLIDDFIQKCQAIAIGPGLSNHPSTQKLALKIIKKLNTPLVIDADGLNALSNNIDTLNINHHTRILTPHPGEMRRLIGHPITDKNRKQETEHFTNTFNKCVLLLKGEKTLVSKHGREIYVNSTGNAGLATAGSGDVLTGIIVGFLAQGLSDFEAAAWGARVHGLAADLAAKKIPKASMIASDLITYLPSALKQLGAV